MKEVRFNNNNNKYSVYIGSNILRILPSKILTLCPKAKKIALIFDKNIPHKFKKKITKNLKKYELISLTLNANEKAKSLQTVNNYVIILTMQCGKLYKVE